MSAVNNEGDLIDLHGKSPVLPRASPTSRTHQQDFSDHLLDTELPVLEEQLQIASRRPPLDIRRPSVDVEDILISIDDDYETVDNRSDLCAGDGPNASAQQALEECLEDLDHYLQSQENQEEAGDEDMEDEVERLKLRRIEENYHRYLAAGCENAAYEQTELSEKKEGRPLSACDVHTTQLPTQRHKTPATVAVVRRHRHPLGDASPVDSDEEIDWSWVQEVARDMTSTTAQDSTCAPDTADCAHESATWAHDISARAHTSADCCTGSVVLETPPEAGSTWLRSSMRRLRHLRIPSTQGIPAESPREVEMGARPLSAPSRISSSEPDRSVSRQSVASAERGGRARSNSDSSRSRRRRSVSSSESSSPSSVNTTGLPAATVLEGAQVEERTRSCDRSRQSEMPEADSPLGHWPHSLSSMMACLGCTLGLFNISRFSILTVHFGANFIFQFIFLSVVFGLPLFTLQLCLGQQLGAGVIDMWRISPLFQGVGVSLLIAQALTGLYSIVGVSWMFVFFRDSFITKVDKYRWAESYQHYRLDILFDNGTDKINETLPDYFNGVVLQRHHLPSGNAYGTIKFQLAFNLAVVWLIVFVSLSKGLRSYGKVIYAFTLMPVFGTFILCAKILGLMPPEYVNVIFPETSWGDFFLNPKSWLAAGQEVFMTWGLMGAAIMQIASHNKHKHLLQRDSSLVAIITLTILLLVAFLANTCVQILKSYGYIYVPNSFERMSSGTFLRYVSEPLPSNSVNLPVRNLLHNSFIMGEKVVRPNVDYTSESGYQVLRLATELVPATFAVMGSNNVSPFWAVLFYFILIMFGIAQQLAIWHCVITGIMAIKANVLKSWETTITFFSCACGFILGLPMATEMGIFVVYFFDYTVGGIWWLLIVILLQILAVFMVRGRPYSGDTVVTALFYQSSHPCFLSWAPALLSFTWNVILPVSLMILCIVTFKNGNFRDMFIWHHAPVAEYWPLWARQVGSVLQLFPILCIPLVAVIQSYRYLNNGPSDILDLMLMHFKLPEHHTNMEYMNERIQLLYRPPIGEHMDELAAQEAAAAVRGEVAATAAAVADPPPKYTPPPSYTTATGARLAKFLRQSIRRSVRRIANVLGEGTSNRQRASASGGEGPSNRQSASPPPPDYNAVLVEMSGSSGTAAGASAQSSSSTRMSTLERLRRLESSVTALTAAEVASILRSSFRRSTVNARNNARIANFNDTMASLSAQNLVDSAVPIGQMSLVMDHLDAEAGKNQNNSSVI